jgi:hypothetical protein
VPAPMGAGTVRGGPHDSPVDRLHRRDRHHRPGPRRHPRPGADPPRPLRPCRPGRTARPRRTRGHPEGPHPRDPLAGTPTLPRWSGPPPARPARSWPLPPTGRRCSRSRGSRTRSPGPTSPTRWRRCSQEPVPDRAAKAVASGRPRGTPDARAARPRGMPPGGHGYGTRAMR